MREISELQFLGEYASRKVFAKGMESRGGGEVGCGASQFGRFQTIDSGKWPPAEDLQDIVSGFAIVEKRPQFS